MHITLAPCILLLGLTVVVVNGEPAKFEKTDAFTKNIIDVGAKVGLECGGKGKNTVELGKTGDSDFMKCTVTESKALKQPLPKGLFQAFFESLKSYGRQNTMLKRNDIDMDTWKLLIEDALQGLLPEDLKKREKGSKGEEMRAEIKALMSDKTNKATFETIFGTKFQPILTGTIKKELKPFGTGVDGAVYEVSGQGVPNAIFKAVPAASKEPVPLEFSVQQQIYDLQAAKFVPQPFEKGRSKNGKWDFMIMEKLGPVITELAKDTKKGLLKTDVERVLARALAILKVIHEAGIAHNDAHKENWAVSQTNKQVLELFDFGRAVNMKQSGDWMPGVSDFRSWVALARELVDKYKADNVFFSKYNGALDQLSEEFNKVTWQNPDFSTITIPFADFKLGSEPEFKKFIQPLYTLAEATFDTKKHGFASTDAITQWSATNAKPPGGRRRR